MPKVNLEHRVHKIIGQHILLEVVEEDGESLRLNTEVLKGNTTVSKLC